MIKGQQRAAQAELLPAATAPLTGTCTSQRKAHNYLARISFSHHCASLSPSLFCVCATRQRPRLCVSGSLSRLVKTGSSLNGHPMRHTLNAKWSSCHRRALSPAWILNPPPLEPTLYWAVIITISATQTDSCCYGDRQKATQ